MIEFGDKLLVKDNQTLSQYLDSILPDLRLETVRGADDLLYVSGRIRFSVQVDAGMTQQDIVAAILDQFNQVKVYADNAITMIQGKM